MLGSLAGIGEIARATFGSDGSAAAATAKTVPRRRASRPVRHAGFTTPGYTPPA